MENRYRAAIVGLGNIAWRFDDNSRWRDNVLTHASAYRLNPETDIIAGCAPDANDRQAFSEAFHVPVYDTIQTLVDEQHPDIMSICSPAEHHYEQVMCCFDNGIPMIWLEKPPACSQAEIKRLIRRNGAEDVHSRVLVNYQRRYTESYQDLKMIFRNGRLGKCRLIQASYSRGLVPNGSHILDMIFFLVGDNANFKVEWVSGFGDQDNPSFAVVFENRLGAVISATQLPYHNIDITLVCDHGRASVRHGGMSTTIENKTAHELFPGFFRLKDEASRPLGDAAFRNSMVSALADLILCHKMGKAPESSLASAENTQRLIETVRQMQGARMT